MSYQPQRGAVTSSDRKRLTVVACFVLLILALLIIQFFRLQILQGDKWAKIARSQHQIIVTEPFKRGVFYSNGSLIPGHPNSSQTLVRDITYYHLYVDPVSIPDSFKEEISTALAQIMGLNEVDKGKILQQLHKKNRSRKLMLWLDKETKENLLKWWNPYSKKNKIVRNGVFFVEDYKRSYPFGKLLGSILHTLREGHDATSQECIPTGGLELYFDKILQGKQGKRMLLRCPKSPMDTGKVIAFPENGADVYLTIDHHIQAIAEEEIEKAVKNANAKGGWVVMMEPYTGEIMAMAQYPSFDPSNYKKYFNDPKLLEDTKVKAVTDAYEPGSIMKPISMAIALLGNKEATARGKKTFFNPNEKIAVRDGRFPGRSKPITDISAHNYMNMYMGLQKSSNIYVARVIQKVIDNLGDAWYRDTLHEVFGFGKKTGIELHGESSGLLPSIGKKHPNGALEWSTPTPFSLAMGYNLLATSLQMLRAHAVIANGGFEVKPTLVKKISRKKLGGGEEILFDSAMLRGASEPKRVLDEDIVEIIKNAEKFATKPGGTTPRADILGYTEAGKTGTSEKIIKGVYSKDHHLSTFIGFAPVKTPKFIMLIAIDDPEKKLIPGMGRNQHGGVCAAPAFREIGTKALQYMGVEPDDPHGYPTSDPRHDPEKADWYKEVKALKSLYDAWNR